MEVFIVVAVFASAVAGRLYLAKLTADWLDKLPPEQLAMVRRHAGAQ